MANSMQPSGSMPFSCLLYPEFFLKPINNVNMSLLHYKKRTNMKLVKSIQIKIVESNYSFTQSLQRAPVPSVTENHKPHHSSDQEVIHHHKHNDAGQILAGTGLGHPQGAVLFADNVLSRLHAKVLNRPAAVRNKEADVYVEDGECGIFIGRLPINYESYDSEEIEKDTEEDTVRDEFVNLVVFVLRVERIFAL